MAAAEWLSALQRLPVILPDRIGYRSMQGMQLETLRLAYAFPDRRPELAGILRDTTRRFEQTLGTCRLVPSHGDLHPENLNMLGGSPMVVTALDLDTAGMRRPSYDVGYAIAMLLVSSWMHGNSFDAGAAAAEAFWRRWSPGGQDLAAVPAEVARALIQSLHFELVTYRTGDLRLLPLWLGLARAALDAGVHGMLAIAVGQAS